MSSDQTEEKKEGGVPKWLMVVLVISAIGLFLAMLFMGVGKVEAILAVLMKYAFFVVIGLVIFYVAYVLFIKEKKVDLVAMQAKKLIESAHLCAPPYLRDVHLSGGRLQEGRKLGQVTGFCKVLNYEGKEENIVTFKTSPGILKLFEQEKILRVLPEDMSNPVGDIYVYSLSLVRISEYHYLHKDMLNVAQIDATIHMEAKRGLTLLMLSDMKTIVDKAVGLDPMHKKDLESQRLIKLPQPNVAPPEQ